MICKEGKQRASNRLTFKITDQAGCDILVQIIYTRNMKSSANRIKGITVEI